MELSTTVTQASAPDKPGSPAESPILQIDFSWRQWKALITKKDDPDNKPLYIVDYSTFFKPQLTFLRPSDNSLIGTGALHAISISPSCVVHGKPITLQALKAIKTSYGHHSPAFSLDGETPMPMTWISSAGFKHWDFVCLDANQMPVAKFSARWWAIKKLAYIEFLGENALSEAVRDEIVIMGLTIYWGMVTRMNNPLNLVGSISNGFSSRGKEVEKKAE